MVNVLFVRPVFLWLLLSLIFLVAIHFITLRTFSQRALTFANFKALERVTGRNLISQNFFILIVMVVVVICMIFSAAGTSLVFETETSSIDFVLSLDASSSMAATDLSPTRFEAAKQAALGFLDHVGGDVQVGLLTFASGSFVEQGVTGELVILREKISSLGIRRGGGTDLGEAITTAVNLLLTSPEDEGRALILLTDGRGNIGVPVSDAITYAQTNLVAVHTIAVGTEEGGVLAEGSDVLFRVDTSLLEDIAESTGGTFHRALTNDDLNQAYEDIAALQTQLVSRDLSLTLLVISLALLVFLWAVLNTKYRTIP